MAISREKCLPRSEEWGQHISEAKMGKCKGVDNHLFGKHLREDVKQQLRERALTPERITIAISNLPKYSKGEGAMLGKHHTEATKAKLSASCKGRLMSDETRGKISKAQKGKIISSEHRMKLSQILKGRSMPWLRTPEVIEKHRQSMKGKHFTEEHRKNLAASNRTRIESETPERRSQRLKNALSACSQKKTKPEIELERLLQSACPNEYRYVGNGQVIIGRRCPDFLNVDGQKKIIEMYGDRWHKGEDPVIRIGEYAEFGFGCLVIWEHELKEKPEAELIDIIKSFNKQEARK